MNDGRAASSVSVPPFVSTLSMWKFSIRGASLHKFTISSMVGILYLASNFCLLSEGFFIIGVSSFSPANDWKGELRSFPNILIGVKVVADPYFIFF